MYNEITKNTILYYENWLNSFNMDNNSFCKKYHNRRFFFIKYNIDSVFLFDDRNEKVGLEFKKSDFEERDFLLDISFLLLYIAVRLDEYNKNISFIKTHSYDMFSLEIKKKLLFNI